MNPNRLTRELRNLPGNIQSRIFPGGSLVSGVLDRNLMTWSDRGGASRLFGEIWSQKAWELLTEEPDILPEHFRETGTLTILRLDANPRIAIQAGRHKLPNPDFLLLQINGNDEHVVRAIDAKFAIDRLRRTQVSPEAVRDLLELPSSLTRQVIAQETGLDADEGFSFGAGAFLAPRSLLNDHFYKLLVRGETPRIPASELIMVEVTAEMLFASAEEWRLMQLFVELDGMRNLDRGSPVLAGMYYLRLACAARWFEERARTPLLSVSEPDPLPIAEIEAIATRRIKRGKTGFEVIREWSGAALRSAERLERVRDAARLPLRMADLKSMLEDVGLGDDRKRIRFIRGALERTFKAQLIDEVGEIPNNPDEPLPEVIRQIEAARIKLRPIVRKEATRLIERSRLWEN